MNLRITYPRFVRDLCIDYSVTKHIQDLKIIPWNTGKFSSGEMFEYEIYNSGLLEASNETSFQQRLEALDSQDNSGSSLRV